MEWFRDYKISRLINEREGEGAFVPVSEGRLIGRLVG